MSSYGLPPHRFGNHQVSRASPWGGCAGGAAGCPGTPRSFWRLEIVVDPATMRSERRWSLIVEVKTGALPREG